MAGSFHIQLRTSEMSDAEVAAVVTAIQKVAPTSALLKDTAVQACYTGLGTKAATLAAAVTTVAEDEQQLAKDQDARVAARQQVDAQLTALKSLVLLSAQSTTDISGMGFAPLTAVATSRAAPDAPAQIVAKVSRVRGRAIVTVVEAAGARGSYVADSTPDPIATSSVWSSMPGTGKRRVVTGASGTKLWVRFAQVRFGLQSDWSTPVLVTLP